MFANPNYRGLSEEEEAEYRQEIAQERWEKEQLKAWARNEGKHVLDPSREWPEKQNLKEEMKND